MPKPTAIIEHLREINEGDPFIVMEPRKLYNPAIIGYSETGDGAYCLCYSVKKYIAILRKDLKTNRAGAYEWFAYNTLRALPYAKSSGTPPIFVYDDN